MSSFTNPLYVSVEQKEIKGRGLLTLTAPFQYDIGYLGSPEIIEVPTGFITDGCSIPGALRWWFPILGRAAKAGVLHDYILYKRLYNKKRAADIFYEALIVLEVNPIKARLMHLAVKYWPWVSDVTQ